MIEVTCAILRKGENILITQRSESMSHPLEWEFPGGKMKPGESPEGCIKREIQEELNVEIEVEALLPSIVHVYQSFSIKLIPFICSLKSGEIALSEHKTYAWIKKNEFAKYHLSDADTQILEKIGGRLT